MSRKNNQKKRRAVLDGQKKRELDLAKKRLEKRKRKNELLKEKQTNSMSICEEDIKDKSNIKINKEGKLSVKVPLKKKALRRRMNERRRLARKGIVLPEIEQEKVNYKKAMEASSSSESKSLTDRMDI